MVGVEAEMHELAIAESLVEAGWTGGQTVRSVRLQVGRTPAQSRRPDVRLRTGRAGTR